MRGQYSAEDYHTTDPSILAGVNAGLTLGIRWQQQTRWSVPLVDRVFPLSSLCYAVAWRCTFACPTHSADIPVITVSTTTVVVRGSAMPLEERHAQTEKEREKERKKYFSLTAKLTPFPIITCTCTCTFFIFA